MSVSVTELLIRSRTDPRDAADALFSRLYQELEGLARRQLKSSKGSTLNTSALVNEVYLKVVDQERAEWADRSHFFAYAARAMRHVLVDRARRRTAAKRGGEARPVTLTDRLLPVGHSEDRLIELGEALERLAQGEPRLAQVVDLRFFAGLTEEEVAEVMSVSSRTVRRDWFKARALLFQELSVTGEVDD